MEFKNLLPDQSDVKVVLNGGNLSIEDATVPFSIGFSGSIAEASPTHVLVITMPHKVYSNLDQEIDLKNEDSEDGDTITIGIPQKDKSIFGCDPMLYGGERKVFELSKINYLQFHKPGKQNVIFVLFSLSRYAKNESHFIENIILKKRSLQGIYESPINIQGIIDQQIWALKVHGRCEVLVDIPSEFFAITPSSGFKKSWWLWVNKWHRIAPVDECEFRNRAIWAVTIQPLVWLLGFMLRLVVSTVMVVVMSLYAMIALIIGFQVRGSFIPRILNMYFWKFLFMYSQLSFTDLFESYEYKTHGESVFMEFKVYSIGKTKIPVPVTIPGILTQLILWFLYFAISTHTYESGLNNSPYEYVLKSLLFIAVFSFLIVANLSFILKTIPYNSFRKRINLIGSLMVSKIEKITFLVLCSISLIAFSIHNIDFILNYIPVIPVKNLSNVNVGLLFWKIFFGLFLLVVLLLIIRYEKVIIKNFSFVKNIFNIKNIGNKVNQYFEPKKTDVEWYKENMNINSLPSKVNISIRQSLAPSASSNLVQKFRVSFWFAKSKVCRPYVKR